MESGSAITRSFRSRISRLRGPGMSVLSSIVLVVAMVRELTWLARHRPPGNGTGRTTRLGRAMVLSDRTIRRLIEEGRIGIDPFDEELVQPSSVDVRVD